MRRFWLIAVFSLFSACGPSLLSPDETTFVSWIVLNGRTQTPISRATVEVVQDGFHVLGETGGEGTLIQAVPRHVVLTVGFTAPGYWDWTIPETFSDARAIRTIYLIPQ